MGQLPVREKMKLVAGFLALAQASCPSDSCWNFNSTTNACTLDTDAGCVELTCQSTGMAIDFSADLFGSGGDGLWLGDIEPSAGGKGFQISANFGDVGSTYELSDDLFIQKIWLAKTGEQRARSSVGHNVIDLGGANDVYTTPFGVGIMFSCEYSRSVTISSDFDVNTVTSFGTKESSGIGNLAGGFSMDLSGAEMTVDSLWGPKCTLVSTGRSLFPMSAIASPIAPSPTETSASTLLMADAMLKL